MNIPFIKRVVCRCQERLRRESPAIACTLTDDAFQQRMAKLPVQLAPHIERVVRKRNGFAIRFAANEASLKAVLDLIRLEWQCCAFLRFRLTLAPAFGPIWLRLSGPRGTRTFLEQEIGLHKLGRSTHAD